MLIEYQQDYARELYVQPERRGSKLVQAGNCDLSFFFFWLEKKSFWPLFIDFDFTLYFVILSFSFYSIKNLVSGPSN